MQRALARVAALCAAIGLVLVFSIATSSPRLGYAAGDPNSGDVWTDNVGQPPGPGHEQDPHLACADINIWGDKLDDSGGSYVIDGWPPTGSQVTAYSGNWSYDNAAGGTQVIAVVNTSQLIANATANGDAPVNANGFHFKLTVAQDPRKSKVFWVACSAAGGVGGATPTPTPTGSAGGTSETPTPTPTPSGGVGAGEASPTPTPESGVLGISASANPTPTPETPEGGILGIGTSVPVTGAAIGMAGLILLGIGVLLTTAAKKNNWLGRLRRS